MDNLLDQFLSDDQPGSGPAGVPPGSGGLAAPGPLKGKLNYSHSAMIDLILAQPGISQNALAAHFGYSASWVSQVMSSDTFQTALEERKAEIIDPSLRMTVEERFKGIVRRSIEILEEKLSGQPKDISDQLALRAFELSSRAAGYGARAERPTAEVNVNLHLEQLGGRLVGLLHKKQSEAVIDAEIEE